MSAIDAVVDAISGAGCLWRSSRRSWTVTERNIEQFWIAYELVVMFTTAYSCTIVRKDSHLLLVKLLLHTHTILEGSCKHSLHTCMSQSYISSQAPVNCHLVEIFMPWQINMVHIWIVLHTMKSMEINRMLWVWIETLMSLLGLATTMVVSQAFSAPESQYYTNILELLHQNKTISQSLWQAGE